MAGKLAGKLADLAKLRFRYALSALRILVIRVVYVGRIERSEIRHSARTANPHRRNGTWLCFNCRNTKLDLLCRMPGILYSRSRRKRS